MRDTLRYSNVPIAPEISAVWYDEASELPPAPQSSQSETLTSNIPHVEAYLSESAISIEGLQRDLMSNNSSVNDYLNEANRMVNRHRNVIADMGYARQLISDLTRQLNKELNREAPSSPIYGSFAAAVLDTLALCANAYGKAIVGRKLLRTDVNGLVKLPFQLVDGISKDIGAELTLLENSCTASIAFYAFHSVRFFDGAVIDIPMKHELTLRWTDYALRDKQMFSVEYYPVSPWAIHPHVNTSICFGDIQNLVNQMKHVLPFAREIYARGNEAKSKISDMYMDFAATIGIVIGTYNASSPYFTYADHLIVLGNVGATALNRFCGGRVSTYVVADLELSERQMLWDKVRALRDTPMDDITAGTLKWILRRFISVSRMARTVNLGIDYIEGEVMKASNPTRYFKGEIGDFITESDVVDRLNLKDILGSDEGECDCGYSDPDSEYYETEHADDCAYGNESYKITSNTIKHTLDGLEALRHMIDIANGEVVRPEPVLVDEVYVQENELNNEVEDENTLF